MNPIESQPAASKEQLKHELAKLDYKRRMSNSIVLATLVILLSLGIGMVGYHYFEHLSWIDCYLNASMILSGMGQIDPLKTEGGKIFAGTYAMFSGVIFLLAAGLIFAPLFRHFFRMLHIEDKPK